MKKKKKKKKRKKKMVAIQWLSIKKREKIILQKKIYKR